MQVRKVKRRCETKIVLRIGRLATKEVTKVNRQPVLPRLLVKESFSTS